MEAEKRSKTYWPCYTGILVTFPYPNSGFSGWSAEPPPDLGGADCIFSVLVLHQLLLFWHHLTPSREENWWSCILRYVSGATFPIQGMMMSIYFLPVFYLDTCITTFLPASSWTTSVAWPGPQIVARQSLHLFVSCFRFTFSCKCETCKTNVKRPKQTETLCFSLGFGSLIVGKYMYGIQIQAHMSI